MILGAVPLWRPLDSLVYNSEIDIEVGDLVRVPLGTRSVSACVVSVDESARDGLKDVEEIIAPGVFPASLIELCLHLAVEHLAFPGETLGLALPRDIMRPPRLPKNPSERKNRILRRLRMRSDEEKIAALFKKTTRPVLIHSGVDYTGLIVGIAREINDKSRQVLLLFPHEPGLARVYERLKPYLEIGLYHAGLGQRERRRIWHGVRDGSVNLVAGLRSAALLPFRNPGLIVVFDSDSASHRVRSHHIHYNARDLALARAKTEDFKVILISILPAVETLHAAGAGKFNLIERKIRQRGKALIVDMKAEAKGAVLSKPLVDELKATAESRMQALLLLNRLGISARLMCADCGEVLTCTVCGIALKLTSPGKPLECRLCGKMTEAPRECPKCKGARWETLSPGVASLERELRRHFNSEELCEVTAQHRPIITEIEDARIIYGTGAALEYLPRNVRLAAMLSWDAERSRADFRSTERAFREVLYLRRMLQSRPDARLIIQTYRPKDKLLEQALRADFEWFFRCELRRRRELGYPPYRRLVLFTKGPKADDESRFIQELEHEGADLLGPFEGSAGRVSILAKLRRDVNPVELICSKSLKKSGWKVEVDPAEIF